MTEIYICNIENLKNEENFGDYLRNLSAYRQQKIEKLKRQEDKCRSLGVGIIIDEFLKTKGLREKDMIYRFGANGKPYFENKEQLFFNASHSGKYAVCSFSDSEVGCDIEDLTGKNLKVAQRYFTENEKRYIKESFSVNIEEIRKEELIKNTERNNGDYDIEEIRRFVRIWTIKESYLKWLGCGLKKSLNSFEICGLESDKITIADSEYKKECYFGEYELDNAFVCVCSGKDDFSKMVIREVHI